MEIIIKQIRSVLDNLAIENNLIFDDKFNSYNGLLDKQKQLFYGYYFDLRKKIGSDYFLMDISLRILQKPICNIANNIKIAAINERKGIPVSLKKSLIKDLKTNQVLTGLYKWYEIDKSFKDRVTIWSCSIFELTELYDYETQLQYIFEKGQKWSENANDWDFLIDWALCHNNALQALSMLKYLERKEQFETEKENAINDYRNKQYPIDELKLINW
jgi:hypothetical protein